MGLSDLKSALSIIGIINCGLLKNDHIHYDLSYLKELDDDLYVKEVISLFLESTPRLLHEIHNAIDSEDWQTAFQQAHKLKSSAGLLKMERLLKCLSEIESRAKAKTDLITIKPWFESAKLAYESASVLLKKELA